jgi:hypothetical protein
LASLLAKPDICVNGVVGTLTVVPPGCTVTFTLGQAA